MDIKRILKHITWCLNVSITLVSLTRHRDNTDTECCHKNKNCHILIYRFQNPLIKLNPVTSTEFSPVHILQHNKKYYIIRNAEHLNPLLINQQPDYNIKYNDVIINESCIRNILQNKLVNTSVSIAIYSSFSYVRNSFTKNIQNSIIGYTNDTDNRLQRMHLFITPHICKPTFTVTILHTISQNPVVFNTKNLYSYSHITEGQPSYQNNDHINKDILSSEYCVCQHPDKERYYVPNRQSFKPLGNKNVCDSSIKKT